MLGLSFLSPFYGVQDPAHGMGPPIFKVGLLTTMIQSRSPPIGMHRDLFSSAIINSLKIRQDHLIYSYAKI